MDEFYQPIAQLIGELTQPSDNLSARVEAIKQAAKQADIDYVPIAIYARLCGFWRGPRADRKAFVGACKAEGVYIPRLEDPHEKKWAYLKSKKGREKLNQAKAKYEATPHGKARRQADDRDPKVLARKRENARRYYAKKKAEKEANQDTTD